MQIVCFNPFNTYCSLVAHSLTHLTGESVVVLVFRSIEAVLNYAAGLCHNSAADMLIDHAVPSLKISHHVRLFYTNAIQVINRN